MFVMAIDPEMSIGCVRIKASLCAPKRAIGTGHETSDRLSHVRYLAGSHLATDGFRRCGNAFVMTRDFHAVAEIRQAVE